MAGRLEKRFPEKRILITGAGSGLGKALALRFAREGWRIALAEKDAGRIPEVEKLVREAGGDPIGIACDVSRPADLMQAAEKITAAWVGLDILVNNAGIANAGFIEKVTEAEWSRIISINLMGAVNACRAFLPMMKNARRGHLINVASYAGIFSIPEMGSYNATKAAIISMSETLRVELSTFNVGVTVVCPSFINTNLMESFASPDERQRKLAQKMFSNAKTTPEQYANQVYNAAAKNRLYAIVGLDSKVLWILKRLAPETFYKFFARGYGMTVRRKTPSP